ncbi:MAG: response regulator transcription factor [Dehalococcoidia bacterium]
MNSVAIFNEEPLSRARLRSMVKKCKDLELTWEISDSAEMINSCHKLPPDVLMVVVAKVDTELITTLELLNQQRLKTLVLGSQDDHPPIDYLIHLGIHGYISNIETHQAIILAIRTVAHGAYWFDRTAIADLFTLPKNEFNETFLARFTTREKQIARFLSPSHTNSMIATDLGISERTVRFHLRNIYDKLEVNTRSQAILRLLNKSSHPSE